MLTLVSLNVIFEGRGGGRERGKGEGEGEGESNEGAVVIGFTLPSSLSPPPKLYSLTDTL